MKRTDFTVLTACCVFSLLLLQTSYVSAAPITLTPDAAGWYDEHGYHWDQNSSYFVGEGSYGDEYRNFFSFDLSSIAGTIQTATLRAYNMSDGFDSVDPTETWTLYDVESSNESLVTSSPYYDPEGLAVFDYLGAGVVYGSRIVSAADAASQISVDLNAAALLALNSTTNYFAIGGAITTLGTGSPETIFKNSHNYPWVELELTVNPVPAPGTALLLGSALMGILGSARVRSKGKGDGSHYRAPLSADPGVGPR